MFGFSLPLVFGAGVLSFLSPCVLPLVPPYLTYMGGASFEQLRGSDLGVYSLGLGVPFLLAGIAVGPFLSFFGRFKRNLGIVEKLVGVLLVVTGLLFLTGNFTRLSYWFLETFPVLDQLG
jgi:cytochrome c-type biogenesis protein